MLAFNSEGTEELLPIKIFGNKLFSVISALLKINNMVLTLSIAFIIYKEVSHSKRERLHYYKVKCYMEKKDSIQFSRIKHGDEHCSM